MTQPVLDPRLVIFDLDGVVYRGELAIPGAAELVAALHGAGKVVRFATNNSMATRADFAARLGAHGIRATAGDIVTSSSATAEHLRGHMPEVRTVLVLGAEGLLAELAEAGLRPTPAAEAAPADWAGAPLSERYDAVVAGLDPAIDYRRLGIAAMAIQGGARFIATNADVRYPTPDGFVPGAGSIVAAVRTASGADPLVIGKPEPAMFQSILEREGIGPADAVVIGDNPESDVLAAKRAGMASILVLTGIADAETAARLVGDSRPDHTAAGPADVAALLGVSLR